MNNGLFIKNKIAFDRDYTNQIACEYQSRPLLIIPFNSRIKTLIDINLAN